MIPTARELGIGIVTWAPMGAGFLTGAFTSRADFKEGDIRAQHHTKMSEENFDKVLSMDAPMRDTYHRLWDCFCVLLSLLATCGTR